jgi:Transglutaminase-like superfamily
MNRFLILCCFFCCLQVLQAQDKSSYQFKKVTEADFQSAITDSSAGVVVLADVGKTEFIGNDEGGFSLVYKRHKRILIRKYKVTWEDDLILYLEKGDKGPEKLQSLDITDYYLENGAVSEKKYDTKEQIRNINQQLGNSIGRSITYSQDCIVDMSYSIQSYYVSNLRGWNFQTTVPCLYSEYSVSIPDIFGYATLKLGSIPLETIVSDKRMQSFAARKFAGPAGYETGGVSHDALYNVNVLMHDRKWILRNAPAIYFDIHRATHYSQINSVEFQWTENRNTNQAAQPTLYGWKTVKERLLSQENFGLVYLNENNWLEETVANITKGLVGSEDKARSCYRWVRDNFKCTDQSEIYLTIDVTLKDIFQRKQGSVSDLNLLLIALLRKAGIQANPVLLSWRSRGTLLFDYPILNKFNYLVVEANLIDKKVLLDAAEPLLGFGLLHPECYNGPGWVIGEEIVRRINLLADNYLEEAQTIANLKVNEQGLTGSISKTYGIPGSFNIRQKIKESGEASIGRYLQAALGKQTIISGLTIDSILLKEESIAINYEIQIKAKGDSLVFEPVFSDEYIPVINPDRTDPVEMPYTRNLVYVMNLEIEKGYQVVKLPKSVKYQMNGQEAVFEFQCVQSGQTIQLRCKIQIKKANFSEEAIEALRDYIQFVTQKLYEPMVIKKI